jgi:hypothetical protein
MSARKPIRSIDSDHTGNRIRAYLASMQLDPDVEFADDITAQCNRARSLMERLAISAPGEQHPTLKLSVTDCADILTYMSCSVPLNRHGWWDDKAAISHVCGYNFVLDAMADSLRARRRS